jgi:hypothetical protein
VGVNVPLPLPSKTLIPLLREPPRGRIVARRDVGLAVPIELADGQRFPGWCRWQ